MAKNIEYKIKVGVIGDAQLQKFQRTVNQINKSAKANVSQMKRMGDGMQRVGNLARGAAVYLAGMFSVQQTRTAIDFADAIGKTAEKLGIGTDALQEYRFAAEQTGVAQQAFDVGFQRFTRRTAEAAKGTGVLAKEFEALGISLKNADGSLKGNEELFRQYADAIKGTASSSEQLRLAFAAFDTEGAGLVNLLKDGSDGLDRFSKAAKDAGVIMSQQVIKDAERLADTFGKISLQIKANLYPVLIGMADVLLRVGDNIKQFVKDVKALEPAAVVVAAAFGGIAAAITYSLVPAFVALTAAVKAFMLSNPLTAIAYAATAAAVAIVANWGSVTEYFEYKLPISLQKLRKSWADVNLALLQSTVGVVSKITAALDQLANSLLGPINLYREWKDLAPLALNTTEAAVKGLNKAMDAQKEISLNAYAAVADLEGAMLGARYEAKLAAEKDLPNLNATLQQTAVATEATSKKIKEFESDIEKAAKSIDDSLARSLEDGIINAAKGSKNAFKDMAKSILEDIARMAIQLRIIKPLMQSLGGGFGGSLASLFGSARGNYFPNGITGKPLTAFASGGVVGSRSIVGSNLIGEAGPEAVVPLRRHNGQMGVAASPVNVNVINNAGAEVQVSESTGNNGERMLDIMIEQKVRNSFATGGMDKMMGRYGLKPVGG